MALINTTTDQYNMFSLGDGFLSCKDKSDDVMSNVSTADIDSDSTVSTEDGDSLARYQWDVFEEEEVVSGSFEIFEPASALDDVGPASFKFLDNLGEGAFGQVFLAQHKATGNSYAMKALDRGNTQAIECANAERAALGRVGPHPYIVRLFASFETESRSVLVLEYCSGGDLQHLINWEGRLSEPLARLYAAEVLLALGHVHKRGLVFRDLKPENVLLDADGHARLADFGLASPDQNSEEVLVAGTPAFMAPELLEGRFGADSGRMADIYGLGVLVFNMLAGAAPFSGRSRKQLFENICRAPLKFPAKFGSDQAKTFVSDLMERETAQRMGAVQTVLVQDHVFFAEIDFKALLRQEVSMPMPARRKSIFSKFFGFAK